MAVLKDLIVHGNSCFLNTARFNALEADTGKFNKLATKILGNDGETITVYGLMDVQGELHTKSWTNSNIATIDGSFFICPTLKVTETGSTTNGLTITQSDNTWSVQITSSSAVVTNSVYTMNSSGTVTSTGTWTIGSKVTITGEILINNEWLPLGTLRGIITERSSDLKSVKISHITDGYSSSNNILDTIGVQNNVKHRNVKISLYEWTLSDSSTPASAITNPIGIYMTALGDGTGQTMIDIYGGQETASNTYKGLAKPYVRIGNLSGLSSLTIGGQNPKGWGIYTSNGYFEGTIAARRGYIGNNTKYWTIGTSGSESTIYSGPSTINTNTAGTYLGTDGFLNFNTTSQLVRITGGKIYALGADITGAIKADTGRIGGTSGWTIASQQIYSTGKTIGADDSMFLSTKNLAGTVAETTLTTTAPSWRLTVGSNFGVDNTGKLYASNAKITGTIVANAGSIGGVTISKVASNINVANEANEGALGTIVYQYTHDGTVEVIYVNDSDEYYYIDENDVTHIVDFDDLDVDEDGEVIVNREGGLSSQIEGLDEILSTLSDQVDDFKGNYDDFVEDTGRELDNLEATQSSNKEELDNAVQNLQEYINQYLGSEGYIDIVNDDTNPHLEIGKTISGQKFYVQLSATEMGFWQGENKVAWINDRQLHIQESEIESEQRLGNFLWMVRNEGDRISLRYSPK